MLEQKVDFASFISTTAHSVDTRKVPTSLENNLAPRLMPMVNFESQLSFLLLILNCKVSLPGLLDPLR